MFFIFFYSFLLPYLDAKFKSFIIVSNKDNILYFIIIFNLLYLINNILSGTLELFCFGCSSNILPLYEIRTSFYICFVHYYSDGARFSKKNFETSFNLEKNENIIYKFTILLIGIAKRFGNIM